MKFAVLLALLIPVVASADTSIDVFSAKSTSDKVTVEWKTGVEILLDKFDIERALLGSTAFEKVGSVTSKGNYSFYSFVDESGFLKGRLNPTAAVYQYRLKINQSDGKFSYSRTVIIEHSVSRVEETLLYGHPFVSALPKSA